MKTLLISVFLLSVAYMCSENKDSCAGSVPAALVNLEGLDGCGWVIELADGQRLEPVNLSDFDIQPEEGLPVRVTYQVVEGASICMVGPLIRIDCLVER